ncbi:MAG TPA: hypothetical protein VGW35_07230 [Methylomirabilota bacterium]|nr:hypothetical protein [Methylomirabilota bacterium]
MERAPELTPGGCQHPPCLCEVDPGKRFCCLLCARGGAEADDCACGHFGCTGRIL